MPEGPVYVEADSARMIQVMCNLLNNAAKFMDEGGRIELSVDEQDGAAYVRVRDYGAGIPPYMLEQVFERFVQADAVSGSPAGYANRPVAGNTLVELHVERWLSHDGPCTGASSP